MEIDFSASAPVTYLDSPASPDTLPTHKSVAASKLATDKVFKKPPAPPRLRFSGIRVEAPYNKGGSGQCHRCQRYGHTAANCHASPRCIKRLVLYWTKECTRTKESEGKPACVNCGSDYPANYRGCSKAPKIKPKRNNYRTDKNQVPYVPPPIARDDRNFPALGGKNLSKATNGGFRFTPVPSTNPWFRNQPPRAASESPKEAIRRGPLASSLHHQPSRPRAQQRHPSERTFKL